MTLTQNETYRGLPPWEAIREALVGEWQNLIIAGKLTDGDQEVDFNIGLELQALRSSDEYAIDDEGLQQLIVELLSTELRYVQWQNQKDFPIAAVVDVVWTVQ